MISLVLLIAWIGAGLICVWAAYRGPKIVQSVGWFPESMFWKKALGPLFGIGSLSLNAVSICLYPTSASTLVFIGIIGVSPVLLIADAYTHRLPNRAVLVAALALGVGIMAYLCIRKEWPTSIAIVAGLAMIVLLFLGTLFRQLGMGDFKLGSLIAIACSFVGPGAVFSCLFVTFVSAGVWVLVHCFRGTVKMQSHIALGPWLLLGTLVVAFTR